MLLSGGHVMGKQAPPRTDLLLLQTNVCNLNSFGCFFWLLAKAPADILPQEIRSAGRPRCGGLWVVNVARRQHESRKRKAPK
jgi:hypothetical protein